MKKLLLSLMLVSGVANADVWVMPNNGNGEITITTDVCKADNGAYPALKHAYTWTDKTYFEGCWGVIDGNVQIIWVHHDGNRVRRGYPLGAFNKKQTY